MDLTTKGSTLITVSIKVDPEKIKNNYQHPSTDKRYPTGIDRHDVSITAIGSGKDAKKQEGPDLDLNSDWGDVISFSFATTPDNSPYTASIYGIQYYSGDQIFSEPETKGNSIELQLQRRGMTTLLLLFGIYTKDGNGQPKDLIGCFYLDPSITIR